MTTPILYIHGFGGGTGGTARALQKELGPAFTVHAPQFFESALTTAAAFENECRTAATIAAEINPAIVIGSSLGGFVAAFPTGYKRILVNPCFQPSAFVSLFAPDVPMAAAEVEALKALEKTIPADKTDVFGLFSREDELFEDYAPQFQSVFKAKFNPAHFFTMVDGHKISADNIKQILVPLVLKGYLQLGLRKDAT
jgi:predicted esterase YcpF (UPF0227 family)